MKRLAVLVAGGLSIFLACAARADLPRVWYVTSPEHDQTFAYGSESHRAWSSYGNPPHLLLFLDYTNDPYVDRSNPREYDNFSFDFPNVKLQSDGHTFSYLTPGGHAIPVALKQAGFLGIDEIKLLPTSKLIIAKPHGYLTLTLMIEE
jgi:hypothetical protein